MIAIDLSLREVTAHAMGFALVALGKRVACLAWPIRASARSRLTLTFLIRHDRHPALPRIYLDRLRDWGAWGCMGSGPVVHVAICAGPNMSTEIVDLTAFAFARLKAIRSRGAQSTHALTRGSIARTDSGTISGPGAPTCPPAR